MVNYERQVSVSDKKFRVREAVGNAFQIHGIYCWRCGPHGMCSPEEVVMRFFILALTHKKKESRGT